ncbi:MAG: diguanylate cyclase [Vicinamibacterales bacterium]
MLMTVHPRAVAGAAALLIAAFLLLLFVYRRRNYILYWSGAWFLTALAMLLASRDYTGEKTTAFAYGLSQFLSIVSGLVFVLSADAYRSRVALRKAYAVALLPVFLWFALSPLVLGPRSVFAPGHLLIGGSLVAAGAAHLFLVRGTRLVGAAVAGLMLVLTGVAHVWIAYSVADPNDEAAAQVVFVMTAAFLLTALGMQLMTFEDMTYELRLANRDLERAQTELRELVITDPLTTCRNRRFFDEIIGRELQRHRRYEVPLSMIFVDVDRFKAINDTHGHEAGDQVLQAVAGFLMKNVREADYVFRWGGDEFLILLSCREAEARARAAALQSSFAKSAAAAGLPHGVGLSIGVTEVPVGTTDIMRYVKEADERMYADKRASR